MLSLVLAYDDSPDARNALQAAGALHPGWQAIVVHAWTAPAPPVTTGAGGPMLPSLVGRRGLGRVGAAVLGSVSDALVREAPLPVLVVPGRE